MVKNYVDVDGNKYVVGYLKDIKPLYKSIVRAWKKSKTDLYPLYESVKFSENRLTYGIWINADGQFYAVSADVILAMIIDGEIEEEA